MKHAPPSHVAFAGHSRIAEGSLADVARAARTRLDEGDAAPVAIFAWPENEPVDVDLRGTPEEVAALAEARERSVTEAAERTTRGRPRLGVVGREVTLLPRHWDWLNVQPGGASVTLRKLVDAARKEGHESERIRRTQDRAHRFMYALAGDLPGFEEAARALYAWDVAALEKLIRAWPADVRDHVRRTLREGGSTP
ncbi:MAG: DUF2239 family protein [Candidatus Krumholzibacteriia bacterium]